MDAGRFARGRTVREDFLGCGDDFFKAPAQLVEQPRAAGHRVPEERVDLITVHVADHQNLQVVHVHVEDAGCGDSHGFENAVGDSLAVAGR